MKRFLQCMFVGLGTLGFFLLLGTAGAESLHHLTFLQATAQSLFGLLLLVVGFFGSKNLAKTPAKTSAPALRLLKGRKNAA